MVVLCGRSGGRILEPSAGCGRIYRAIRRKDPDSPVVLVDNSPGCVDELHRQTEGDELAKVVAGDFLGTSAATLGGLFDRILMNPPFQRGTDIKHILHARELLQPGGRLVALCANGPRQRAQLMPLADEWHELPADTFASEGTRVAVAMLAMISPDEL